MKFTLNLCDYLEQYVINLEKHEPTCPVCYDHVFAFEKEKDIEHILDCYKINLIERYIDEYFDEFGDWPVLSEKHVVDITSKVDAEVAKYHDKYKWSI